MNRGLLFELVIAGIEHEIEQSNARSILVVNADDEFIRRRMGGCPWTLTNTTAKPYCEQYNPILASKTLSHDFIICNELPSFEALFAVLSNSAQHAVKTAIVIGDYALKSKPQLIKHWEVNRMCCGKSVYILTKITKSTNARKKIAKDFMSKRYCLEDW